MNPAMLKAMNNVAQAIGKLADELKAAGKNGEGIFDLVGALTECALDHDVITEAEAEELLQEVN